MDTRFGKIIIKLDENFVGTCHLYTMVFEHGWSASDYRLAAEEMYRYMDKVSPDSVFVIADFSADSLTVRKDILAPVWIDKDILPLSVKAPKNREAVYFVFSDTKLLNFAKFAASAYQRFMDDLLNPEYITNDMSEARSKIKSLECCQQTPN